MGGHYLKANRTTKMTSGNDHFFYEDDLDAILPIMDAYMFENYKDMESEIVTCIKKLSSGKNYSFKYQFCLKLYLSKEGLSKHKKGKHQMHITQDSVRHCDSGGLKSRLERTDFSSIYENAQVVKR